MKDILEEAGSMSEEITAWRRHLHEIPELGLETPKTAAFIVQELKKMGVGNIREKIGGWGVAAVIEGALPGKVLAIRADCDALPIKEETGLPFASKSGLMHACGHDAHTAMALGAAKLLLANRDKLAGTVKFIFQPAEENVQGAKAMIDDGVMENPAVDAVIGLHTGCLWKEIGPGEIGVRFGSLMAAVDRFIITFKGKGGHGATPHLTVDPVTMTSTAVLELQTILSRELSPLDPAVLTIGRIEGGRAFNIIAESCTIEGTVRTLSPETRAFVEERIRAIASRVAEGMRGEAEVKYESGPPALINDRDFTKKFQEFAAELAGADKVKEISEPTMGGEDVAFFLEKVPGTFFVHGSCNPEKGQVYPHHNPKFDIDEDTLPLGSALFAGFALNWQK
ncbi:MAG: amidohydrolase [Synergistales bacterium]|uniref:M20 metallopeptidase family protein n=1 Tax=Aminivibrio sp. TaxID=1872489 RepID=UPI001DFC5310|nr:M20 family metallopeptidase [Synergistaceae bacterium]MDD4020953.1 M20 family metallopeptidase [Synergistaceae bacterium]MDD4612755.1 M20 family metallopeptidase [Synergistaceae bacterium]NCC56140.1 amidohydrolase [Synergistales bacterium]